MYKLHANEQYLRDSTEVFSTCEFEDRSSWLPESVVQKTLLEQGSSPSENYPSGGWTSELSITICCV